MPDLPVVGIVGQCCAGKDLATSWFTSHGWQEINVDSLGHEALEELRDTVVAAFGPTIVAADGTSVDRQALGAIVFGSAAERLRLEAIVHPWMRERAAELVDEYAALPEPPAGIAINAALLVYMNLHPLCDRVVLVTAPWTTRLARALARDGWTLRRALARLWSQRSLPAQVRQARADTISVANGSTPDALFAQLAQHF